MDPGALQFFEQHFAFYDDRFEYSNVRGIRWKTIERIKTIYFLPIGTSYTYELSIEFASGRPLDLGVGSVSLPSWISPALNGRAFTEFSNKVAKLHDETRAFRLLAYKEQLQRDGFFEYDGMAFFADGSVQHDGRRRSLDLSKRAQANGAITKLSCAPSGSISVSTLWDRDCFHAILNEVYGARTNAQT